MDRRGVSGIGWGHAALIVSLAMALCAIRVTGPSDLMDNDQLKPAHYVHDVVLNGHWIVQRDTSGDIASKPPLQVWIGAVASLPFGRAYWWTLAIPSVLGVIVTALVAGWFGARVMPKDPNAPLFAGMLVLVSMMGAKQVALVRTDALFGGSVALCGLCAWLATQRRASWVWFWVASALSTLTKGPLGPVIALFGLLAQPWRGVEGKKGRWWAHAIGAAIFLALVGGWVWLAYLDSGQAFFDKVLGNELVGHAVASRKGSPPVVGFYKSPGYFLWWYAPAAPLALFAVFTMWKHTDERVRTLVRFLACWMLGGLVLFALSPHQRADLLTPIWTPCGALAGVVLARWASAWKPWLLWGGVYATTLLMMGGVLWHRHYAVLDEKHIVRAREIEAMVQRLAHRHPRLQIVSHSGHSYFDFVRGEMSTRVDQYEAMGWSSQSTLHAITVNKTWWQREDVVVEDYTVIDMVKVDDFVLEVITQRHFGGLGTPAPQGPRMFPRGGPYVPLYRTPVLEPDPDRVERRPE